MKGYKSYKPSEFKWIGDIPNHWLEGKIMYYFSIGRGRVISQQELDDKGIYPVYSSQTKNDGCLGFINTYDFEGDMLTWTTDGANAGEVFQRSGKYNCTNVCGTLIPKNDLIDLKYYLYYLKFITQFYKRPDTNGAKIMNNEMANVLALIPTKNEQTQIAAFLDHHTGLIDALIAKKEALIEKLKQQRQAIINEVVTGKKVWNPATNSWTAPEKTKESGIEWLGEIPDGWEISKVKWELEFHNNKRVPLESEIRFERQGQYPYYGASGIIDFVDDFIFEGKFILVGEDGANILSRSTPLAFIATGKFWVNNHAHILKSKTGNDEYFCMQLELNDFSTIASGSAQPKLTKDALANVQLVVPSLEEQNEIITYLDYSKEVIDGTCQKITEQIEKLKLYRQSLISEAVTGKIDVREWKPKQGKA